MLLKELIEKRNKIAAQLKASIEKYNENRAAQKAGFEDKAAEEAFDKLNREHDELTAQIDQLQRDDLMNTRMQQINESADRSLRNARPHLDTEVPGLEGRTYGDAFGNRDAASQYNRRQRQLQLAFRAFILNKVHSDPGVVNSLGDETRDAITATGLNPTSQTVVFGGLDTLAYRSLQAQVANMSPVQRANAMASIDTRNLSFVTAGQGADLVPTYFAAMLAVAELSQSPLLSYIEQVLSDNTDTQAWPGVDDTGNNKGAWAAEGTSTNAPTVTETGPATSKQMWGANPLHSRWCKVPWTLSLTSAYDVESMVAQILGARIGESLIEAAMVGTGSGQPTGMLLAFASGGAGRIVTSGAAASVEHDDLVSLEFAVQPNQRMKFAYACNDSTVAHIRKKKSTTGVPLWSESFAAGQPDRINGKPMFFCNYIPTIAANTVSMLGGDFSQYKMKRLRQNRLTVARELFSTELATGFMVFTAADGKILRPSATQALCPIQALTQKA